MDHSLLFKGIPPALIFIIGGLLIPAFKGKLKLAYMLALPLYAFFSLLQTPEGNSWHFSLLQYDLILCRIDRLSLVFGYIFCIISWIAVIFALKIEDDLQHVAGFVYAGGALGVTFAGDLFTLYLFWEIMAVSSTFLILARRTRKSQTAAFRYIMVHVAGGLLLLAGILIYIHDTGSPRFDFIGLSGTASYLIFLGIAVNAAIPPLHPWLQDAYPEATVTGAVFLSAFTTKSAVYCDGQNLSGSRTADLSGGADDGHPHFLRGARKRYPACAGLQPDQSGGLHDVRHRHRNAAGHQRHRSPRLLPHPL